MFWREGFWLYVVIIYNDAFDRLFLLLLGVVNDLVRFVDASYLVI